MVRRSLWIWGALLIWVLGIAGCAKPPTQEIEVANAAVESARKAEAEKYAVQEFSALRDSLNATLAEVDRQKGRFSLLRNYDHAKALASRVTAMADEVQGVAMENKAEIRSETQDLIAKAQAAVEEARSFVGRAPVGKGSQADIEQFKADLSALEVSLSEARSALFREEFMAAKAKAQAIQSGAEGLKGQIQVAIDKYTQWRRGRRG